MFSLNTIRTGEKTMNRSIIILCTIVLGLVSQPASATIINLIAEMDGPKANAGAGTGSAGIGTGTVTLDDVTGLMNWSITWGGLIGAPAAMHFHGPANPNQNAGVQVDTGVAGPPVVGNTILAAAQMTDLLAGLWYLNLHTTAFPGGEIRGQVLVVRDSDGDAVPAPAIAPLIVFGLGGLGIMARRRRAAS